MDWFDLTHDRDKLQALVNMEIKLLFPPNAEKFD
jgi:hypothetical protein